MNEALFHYITCLIVDKQLGKVRIKLHVCNIRSILKFQDSIRIHIAANGFMLYIYMFRYYTRFNSYQVNDDLGMPRLLRG